MVRHLLAAVLLLAPAALAQRATFTALPGGVVAVSLPPSVLQTPVVKKQLASGLTTTFVIAARRRDRDGRGGARIEIRYDLWDEVYQVRRIEIDNRRDVQTLTGEQLEKWWRTAVRIFTTADERVLLDVELLVLPFSTQEERDARDWLSKSGSAGTAGASGAGGLIDVLIGTTISARPIVSFRWTADLLLRGGR